MMYVLLFQTGDYFDCIGAMDKNYDTELIYIELDDGQKGFHVKCDYKTEKGGWVVSCSISHHQWHFSEITTMLKSVK